MIIATLDFGLKTFGGHTLRRESVVRESYAPCEGDRYRLITMKGTSFPYATKKKALAALAADQRILGGTLTIH